MNTERLQFVQQMIIKLRTFLLSSDVVTSISIDGGGAASFDRSGAWKMLQELEQEEQNLVAPRRMMKTVDLRDSF